MAITEEYIELARSVSILDVLSAIESEYGVNFKVTGKGGTSNLVCPHQLASPEESEHKDEKLSRTSISESKNKITCWVAGCPVSKGLNTIDLVMLFDEELSFSGAVKKVLSIGGYECEFEKSEISEERRIELLLTRYVNEKSRNLQYGYSLLEEKIEPTSRAETMYLDAAKYLKSRGISKLTASRLMFGIGGGPSDIVDKTSKDLLRKAKIISEKGFEYMRNRIIVPNICNKIAVNMTGRDLDPNSTLRYLNVGSVKSFVNIDKAKEYDTIYMFEGGINGASYIEIEDKPNAVFLQGSNTFTKTFLIDLIKENVINEKKTFKDNVEIVIVGDPDFAGVNLVDMAGMQMLESGFMVSVILMPTDENGKKIDLNDILKENGLNKAKELWGDIKTRKEPYIVFKIKDEISKLNEPNKLCYEMKKAKIMEKYLSLNFINPNERWILEQYFSQNGYPMTKEFFKWADIRFNNEPRLDGERLVCFIGEIDRDLANNLDKNEKPYNILNISNRVNMYEVDKSVEFVLMTNTVNLLVTKKIAERLINDGYKVKIFYSDKPIKSLLEYSFSLNKAMELNEFIESIL